MKTHTKNRGKSIYSLFFFAESCVDGKIDITLMYLMLKRDEKNVTTTMAYVCLSVGPWKTWSLAWQQEVTRSISVWLTVRATPVHLSTASIWALGVGWSRRIVDSHCRSEGSERGCVIACMWKGVWHWVATSVDLMNRNENKKTWTRHMKTYCSSTVVLNVFMSHLPLEEKKCTTDTTKWSWLTFYWNDFVWLHK